MLNSFLGLSKYLTDNAAGLTYKDLSQLEIITLARSSCKLSVICARFYPKSENVDKFWYYILLPICTLDTVVKFMYLY